jgi:KinB signaling pathway activation protein
LVQSRAGEKVGGKTLTLRKWLYLFFTTLAIGGIAGWLVGAFIDRELFGLGAANFLVGSIGLIGAGFYYSLISQMGFFAYLTLQYFGLTLFKNRKLVDAVQIFLIMFVIFDLVYIRYTVFGNGQGPLFEYVLFPLILLAISVVVALFKVKATNATAFIPALFFMFVFTAVELFPALRANNVRSLLFMLIPLLACNTWQLFQLHRLTKKD